MRRFSLILVSAFVIAGCSSQHDAPGIAARDDAATSQPAARALAPAMPARAPGAIANLPDRGKLLTYARTEPVRRTAYTWYPAALSESHALRSIATGAMEFEAPDGTPIRLQYSRHVEHKDGNWTWIGRPEGAQPGTEAIITFGEKAVFGSVPNGDGPPLRVTTTNGRTWVMQTDPRTLKRMVAAGMTPDGPDFAAPPQLAAARDKVLTQASIAPQKLTASGAVPESATVDVAFGYTNTFASRLGGTSQATTRLHYLVDVANVAFNNSQIVGAVRLAGTVALDYPDATDNGAALDALTGVTCTDTGCEDAPIPAALLPLHTLREQVGADLISLVRNFNDPENDSCGIAWLLGSGQDPITQGMAWAGVSVVSDSNGNQFPDNDFICRDETFVHEIAHNMGSAHDELTAQDGDGVTDADDYGRYPYSFGYKTNVGNFFTIMAYRDEGQTPYRVFSNPRITTCGGNACGTANADNARSLGQTMPVVAGFYASQSSAGMRSDFDGDAHSDVWFRNTNGLNVVWRSANINTPQTMTGVASVWKFAGQGNFNGDNRADVLWRNESTGQNVLWYSGNSGTAASLVTVPGTAWKVMGVADFDGDGIGDILWRNEGAGLNRIWKSGNASQLLPVSNIASTQWKIVGVGDFEGDGIADILWRNYATGSNVIWRNGNINNARTLLAVALAWQVVGIGNFDGDGRADILWRNTNGLNTIWRSGDASTTKAVAGVASTWRVACVADFDGDAIDDALWRNAAGQNVIWRSVNINTPQSMGNADSAWTLHC